MKTKRNQRPTMVFDQVLCSICSGFVFESLFRHDDDVVWWNRLNICLFFVRDDCRWEGSWPLYSLLYCNPNRRRSFRIVTSTKIRVLIFIRVRCIDLEARERARVNDNNHPYVEWIYIITAYSCTTNRLSKTRERSIAPDGKSHRGQIIILAHGQVPYNDILFHLPRKKQT
jgi:hypothetical protein